MTCVGAQRGMEAKMEGIAPLSVPVKFLRLPETTLELRLRSLLEPTSRLVLVGNAHHTSGCFSCRCKISGFLEDRQGVRFREPQ